MRRYLFAQIAAVLQQVVHSVGLLPLPGDQRVLAADGKVRQDVHHDFRETVGQQLLPVLLEAPADGPHLLKVVQEDQVRDQDLVRRPSATDQRKCEQTGREAITA